jgi:hypothetical protein
MARGGLAPLGHCFRIVISTASRRRAMHSGLFAKPFDFVRSDAAANEVALRMYDNTSIFDKTNSNS